MMQLMSAFEKILLNVPTIATSFIDFIKILNFIILLFIYYCSKISLDYMLTTQSHATSLQGPKCAHVLLKTTH